MAFGKSVTEAPEKAKSEKTFDPVYLDLNPGSRTVRIVGDDLTYKQQWIKVNVGTVEAPDMKDRPICVGVWHPEIEQFVGEDLEYFGLNPYDTWVNSLNDAEKEAFKKTKTFGNIFASTRFIVNVYDRTEGLYDKDGNFLYPDEDGNFWIGKKKYSVDDLPEGFVPEPHNLMMVLENSSGKKGGKHFHQSIITCAKQLRGIVSKKPIDISESDIQLVTSKNEEGTIIRSAMPSFDQTPLEYPALYDLASFVIPWPHEAIQRLMDKEPYAELRKEYNIPMFPKKLV